MKYRRKEVRKKGKMHQDDEKQKLTKEGERNQGKESGRRTKRNRKDRRQKKGRKGRNKESGIIRILKHPKKPLVCLCFLQPEDNYQTREGHKEHINKLYSKKFDRVQHGRRRKRQRMKK